MASAITTRSTTLEGQLMEIIEAISTVQASADQNPNNEAVISGYTRNMATEIISCSIAINTEDTQDANGNTLISASEVFTNPA